MIGITVFAGEELGQPDYTMQTIPVYLLDPGGRVVLVFVVGTADGLY